MLALGSHRLLVVIPAFNEERRIGAVVRGIRDALGMDGDIVVVNDGSRDATSARAREAGATVIELPFNLGYGSALRAGYFYALKKGYDIVLQMDGDGQHDPSAIPALVQPILGGRAHVVIGSRFLGAASYAVPLARRIGQRLFSRILHALTGKEITDPTSGYQAIHRDVFSLYVSDEFPSDYPDADVLLLLYYRGFSFCEVPATFHSGEKGKTMHAGWKPVYYVMKMLLSMLMVAWRHRRYARRKTGCEL
ncbi:MAG: glycosyltransferase family 2 protein [Candidatus Sumerlaeia bacterium]|nr:glycosyltransferase family 2 protein [Candidatus Sumerlaeia bacterium]